MMAPAMRRVLSTDGNCQRRWASEMPVTTDSPKQTARGKLMALLNHAKSYTGTSTVSTGASIGKHSKLHAPPDTYSPVSRSCARTLHQLVPTWDHRRPPER